MLRKVFSFDESSGALSPAGAFGTADVAVPVDIADGAVEGAGEG
jgi:hypothetical protein